MSTAGEKGWPTPRAILFDLDDTILDDSSNVDSAWRTVCAEAAGQVSGLDAGALFDAIDRTRGWYWGDPERHREGRMDLRAASRGIVHQALVSLGFDLPALARTIAEGYRDLREAGTRPFPDAVESLERLRAAGVRLGLITNGNGQSQRAKIDRFDLARHFEHILIEGEFGVGKPDGRVYLTVMEALRSRPDETWSVGDNLEWDVAAPQRLGIRGVWVDHRRAGLLSGAGVQPDRIICSIAELP